MTTTTKCVPNLSRIFLFGCDHCFFFRELPYLWMTKSLLSMGESAREKKVTEHNINSHRVVASFARECAKSTFIIRIVGFQSNLYIYVFVFVSLKFTVSAFMRFMWLGWVPIPKTHIFHVLFDTRHIPIWRREKNTHIRFESRFVFAFTRIFILLHSICKRFSSHTCDIHIDSNTTSVSSNVHFIFTYAIFVYA